MPVDRAGLCAIGRIQTKDIVVNGEDVRLRMISARERADFIKQFADNAFCDAESRVGLLSKSLVDAEGKQLFESGDDSILDLSADVVEKLFVECLEFNGFGNGRVEQAEKN